MFVLAGLDTAELTDMHILVENAGETLYLKRFQVGVVRMQDEVF